MTVVNLYPPIILEGDLSPESFGDEVDDICNEIHDACEGFGTDEQRLLKVMGALRPDQRCKVPIRYKELHGKELQKVMKSECGERDFGVALQLLAVDPVEADCDLIGRACKGFGTDEMLLLTIICGRSNEEMEILKKKYFDLESKDLGRTLDNELGGSLEQLFFNVLQAAEEEYDPDYHTAEKMEEDAEKLYNLGQGKMGTDETGLFKILCTLPAEYLKELNMKYAEKYGYTLIKTVEKELGGVTQKAALFMLGMKLDPYITIAKLINAACEGWGTNELLLSATLIRYQSILKDVMLEHVNLYEKTIRDRVKEETTGDYKRLLMEVLEAVEN